MLSATVASAADDRSRDFALFYGGLVRTKNMLSVLMWVFYRSASVDRILLGAVRHTASRFSGGSTLSSAASRRPSSPA
jgi:hypothetical protein